MGRISSDLLVLWLISKGRRRIRRTQNASDSFLGANWSTFRLSSVDDHAGVPLQRSVRGQGGLAHAQAFTFFVPGQAPIAVPSGYEDHVISEVLALDLGLLEDYNVRL